MKAPDKIYIQPSKIDELPRQNIIYTKRLSDASIEYIRKDALLEWAKKEQELTISIREDAWWDGVINKLKSM